MYCPKCMRVLSVKTMIETDDLDIQVVECDCGYNDNRLEYKQSYFEEEKE